MAHKGETWNESELYSDPWTLRKVRRVTTRGLYNQSPNYHTNIGFSADGEGAMRLADSLPGPAGAMRPGVRSCNPTMQTPLTD